MEATKQSKFILENVKVQITQWCIRNQWKQRNLDMKASSYVLEIREHKWSLSRGLFVCVVGSKAVCISYRLGRGDWLVLRESFLYQPLPKVLSLLMCTNSSLIMNFIFVYFTVWLLQFFLKKNVSFDLFCGLCKGNQKRTCK